MSRTENGKAVRLPEGLQKALQRREAGEPRAAKVSERDKVLDKFRVLENNLKTVSDQLDRETNKDAISEGRAACMQLLTEWNELLMVSTVLKPYDLKVLDEKYQRFSQRQLKFERDDRPVFSFTSQDSGHSIDVPDNVCEAVAETSATIHVDDQDVIFCDKTDCTLSMTYAEVAGRRLVFERLNDCRLNVVGGGVAIRFTGLRGCTVLCGPVATSVYLEDCHDCTFKLACQQMRAHSCISCQLYVHVTGAAVIEECRTLSFAPYDWQYDGIREHFTATGLDPDCNNWRDVKDFDWLSTNKPSPNWKVMES